MPMISIKMFADLVTDENAGALIAGVTTAVTDVLGDQVRPYVTVLVEPVPRSRWGAAGRPANAADPQSSGREEPAGSPHRTDGAPE